MNIRERKAMSLLKNLYDRYNDLSLFQRSDLRDTELSKKIDEIPAILKLFKSDIGNEISAGVEIARVNERNMGVAVDKDGNIIVL